VLNKIINLSRLKKKIILLFIDTVLIFSVLIISLSSRHEYLYFPESNLIWIILSAPIFAIPIFVRFGLYRAIIRYIGFKASSNQAIKQSRVEA